MRRLLILLVVPLLAASGPTGASIKGHVTFTNGGKEVAYEAGFVYLQTRKRPQATGGNTVQAKIEQRGKKFVPASLVVPIGATVAFPNFDHEEHNVFTSIMPSFDLGRYTTDPKGKTHVFMDADEFSIYCDIHRDMEASVKVVATRPEWIVRVTGGAFELGGIPDGQYRLMAWAPHSDEVVVDVTVSNGNVTTIQPLDKINVALGEIPPHRRKDGTVYPCHSPPCANRAPPLLNSLPGRPALAETGAGPAEIAGKTA